MTSKVSFSKLLKAVWKQQLWVFALSALAYFVSVPLMLMMFINSWDSAQLGRDRMAQSLYELMVGTDRTSGLTLFAVAVAAMAAICAWNGLSYLHSRGKTDLYHALPVRREWLFAVQTCAGVLHYLLSSVLAMVLFWIVAAAWGILTGRVFAASVAALGIGLAGFLLCYFTTALAMLLTGRLLVGILGTLVFYGIGPLVTFIFYAYRQACFYTAVSDRWKAVIPELSPVGLILQAINHLSQRQGWRYALLMLALALVLAGVDVAIYRMRPSEAADRPMAFRRAGEVIKVALTSVAALGVGWLFLETAGAQRHESAWLVFGLVFGLLLFYAVIQMIYCMDIRRALEGPAWLAAAAVVTFGIVAVFRFDLLGYNRYLPAQDQIRSVQLACWEDSLLYQTNVWPQERMKLQDLPCSDAVYQLLEAMVEESDSLHSTSDEEIRILPEGRTMGMVQVEVALKSGRTYQRQYEVDYQELRPKMEPLLEEEGYLRSRYLLLLTQPEQVTDLWWRDPLSDSTPLCEGSRQDRTALVRALQEDLRALHGEDLTRQLPVGILTYHVDLSELGEEAPEYQWYSGNGVSDAAPWYDAVYLYASFTRTLALLEREGIQARSAPTPEMIEAITVWEEDPDESRTYTEPEKIRELAARLCYPELCTWWVGGRKARAAVRLKEPYAGALRERTGEDSVECILLDENMMSEL